MSLNQGPGHQLLPCHFLSRPRICVVPGELATVVFCSFFSWKQFLFVVVFVFWAGGGGVKTQIPKRAKIAWIFANGPFHQHALVRRAFGGRNLLLLRVSCIKPRLLERAPGPPKRVSAPQYRVMYNCLRVV